MKLRHSLRMSISMALLNPASRMLVTYFTKQKDATTTINVLTDFNKNFLTPLRVAGSVQHVFIQGDRGELFADETHDWCTSRGIYSYYTCPHAPEHNGVIERVWRTIATMARAMLLNADLPEPFWEEARRTAVFIYNRIPAYNAKRTSYQSPYETYYKVRPTLSHIKVFGTIGSITVPEQKLRKNHEPRGQIGILVGFQDYSVNGYRVFIPETFSPPVVKFSELGSEIYNREYERSF